ncbi:LuxR family transcriptional regulator [Sphingomonas immobilis]|uniref:LuxR family transcriptional regulator n=1 Tax=Sphingomonas immobilis TaxID=3063997 RepID=A0ABT9A179_9SPHN|nr:LuxR family transcriptional regulator [Sphingomonas sp. CA1-15]MDO7843586.1 LuxR family transcriptional regulator [Sphingomonas sp. CA1-15]
MIEAVGSVDELMLVMTEFCRTFGFDHFALTQHIDIVRGPGSAFSLHNYPESWAEFYETNALGVSDPVHRASNVRNDGFRWSRMTEFIPLTAGDHQMLELGREQGIGEGYTVPGNVPGEVLGSCSFANRAGHPLEPEMVMAAQLAGSCAFERARRLWRVRQVDWREEKMPVLTDRQRDCVLWAARGKGNWEIAKILDVSQETVRSHIRQACERYGVHKRSLLEIRTLADGTLSFIDVLRR